jgi:fluoride ion exporter CrcB/FEX
MFLVWVLVSFRAARRDRRVRSGVATGIIVAFATFCSFEV